MSETNLEQVRATSIETPESQIEQDSRGINPEVREKVSLEAALDLDIEQDKQKALANHHRNVEKRLAAAEPERPKHRFVT